MNDFPGDNPSEETNFLLASPGEPNSQRPPSSFAEEFPWETVDRASRKYATAAAGNWGTLPESNFLKLRAAQGGALGGAPVFIGADGRPTSLQFNAVVSDPDNPFMARVNERIIAPFRAQYQRAREIQVEVSPERIEMLIKEKFAKLSACGPECHETRSETVRELADLRIASGPILLGSDVGSRQLDRTIAECFDHTPFLEDSVPNLLARILGLGGPERRILFRYLTDTLHRGCFETRSGISGLSALITGRENSIQQFLREKEAMSGVFIILPAHDSPHPFRREGLNVQPGEGEINAQLERYLQCRALGNLRVSRFSSEAEGLLIDFANELADAVALGPDVLKTLPDNYLLFAEKLSWHLATPEGDIPAEATAGGIAQARWFFNQHWELVLPYASSFSEQSPAAPTGQGDLTSKVLAKIAEKGGSCTYRELCRKFHRIDSEQLRSVLRELELSGEIKVKDRRIVSATSVSESADKNSQT